MSALEFMLRLAALLLDKPGLEARNLAAAQALLERLVLGGLAPRAQDR